MGKMVQSALFPFYFLLQPPPPVNPPLYKKGFSRRYPNFSPSNMPPKGAQYTTLTDEVDIVLCEHHDKNPHLSQKELIQ